MCDTVESEISEILQPPDDLKCSVCLDIYLNPFICHPCGHVFCEICLRHLGKTGPQNTFCPLCRQQIGICLPDLERGRKIRILYPTTNKFRILSLQNLRNCPLPWQPHYRMKQLSTTILGKRNFLLNRERIDSWTIWETFSIAFTLVVLQLIALFAFFVGFRVGKYVFDVIDYFQDIL